MNTLIRLSPLALLAPMMALAQSPATSTTASEAAPIEAAPSADVAPVDPAAAGGADDAAMLAELMAGNAAAPEGGAESGPSLRFYGFADFGAGSYIGLEGTVWNGLTDEYTSFAIGNLNLFADAQIAEGWSSLFEIRFMFLPHGANEDLGASILDPVSRTGIVSTSVPDYANYDRDIEWGAIHIERAYLQYTPFSFLTVRAGRFLTPYGIWNVDHGTPVIISTSRPYIIGEEFFPEAQTGFELLGSVPVGDSTLGYHLTISNGRGPAEVYRDLDGNKALGARVYLTNYALGQLDVGASGYVGTYTDRRRQLDLSTGAPTFERFDFEKYDEVALSGDIKWQFEDFLIQTEISVQDKVWDDAARPGSSAYGAIAGQTQPDVRRFGVYVFAAYKLPWLNLQPFLQFQHYDTGMIGGLFTARGMDGINAGINVSPVPGVVFKAAWSVAIFDNGGGPIAAPEPLHRVETQVAWAF